MDATGITLRIRDMALIMGRRRIMVLVIQGSVSVAVYDRPYYIHGPDYYVGRTYYVWKPGALDGASWVETLDPWPLRDLMI